MARPLRELHFAASLKGKPQKRAPFIILICALRKIQSKINFFHGGNYFTIHSIFKNPGGCDLRGFISLS